MLKYFADVLDFALLYEKIQNTVVVEINKTHIFTEQKTVKYRTHTKKKWPKALVTAPAFKRKQKKRPEHNTGITS